MIRVQGWDISLNHGAVVEFEDGEFSGCWFYSEKAGVVKRANSKNKQTARRLKIPRDTERLQKGVMRLNFVRDWLYDLVCLRQPDYIGIEDYAIREAQGAHYLGEVGCIARMMCWDEGIKFRLHDPTSVKMFGTLNGNCPKGEVERIVGERWGVDYSRFNLPPKEGSEQDRTTSGDLTDAHVLARLVWTEVQLRAGTMLLSELQEEKERRVFIRVTKTYPVSLLDREWICREVA